MECSNCKGIGLKDSHTRCPECNGTGKVGEVKEKAKVEIKKVKKITKKKNVKS